MTHPPITQSPTPPLHQPVDWLRSRAAVTPERPALYFRGEVLRYGELDQQVEGLAASLWQAGVRPGTRVAALLANSPAYVALIHGLARLGAVLVPLNTRLVAHELTWQLTLTGADFLVSEDQLATVAAAAAPPGCRRLDAHTLVAQTAPAGERPWQQGTPLDQVQAIIFTSGTSGRPKGAMLTFGNHFWSATASLYRLGLREDDRWLSCLPLYHVGGLAVVFRCCLYGIPLVLHDHFEVDAFRASLEADGVTLTSLVPTMLHRLLNRPGEGGPRGGLPASLRLILLGGAAASAELLARCRDEGIPVATTYGLTEAASQVATQRPGDTLRKPGSVGRPLMFTRVQVVDEEGKVLPPGEPGEIRVQGPTVMAGYYQDPEATARALRDGWLHTGDIGYLDGDGDLWLLQRRSDVIVSGGENVYPAEVEAALRQHPAVEEACVVGIPDPEWGQRVAAMVQLRPGHRVTVAELDAFLRPRLAGYKRPRILTFVESLPQTASGKIARRTVAEMLQRPGQ
ncbi:MAG: 2-succinylbenzoate--CoA ligase [Litorilinea sp.]|nr:MAG: 2-succinylbenzoate--CoA ligase [Litorilinea sp.]